MKQLMAVLLIHSLILNSSVYSQAKAGKEAQPKPVRGRIVDSDNRPVSGATIEFQTSSRKRIAAKSDDDGSFQLPLKKADEAPRLLLASNADGTAQAYLSSEELVKRGTTLGDIQLDPARKLDFLVADKEGKPVPGAEILLSSGFSKIRAAKSDKAGKAKMQIPAKLSIQYVLAHHPTQGMDYYLFRPPAKLASDPYRLAQNITSTIGFRLQGIKTIRVRAIDEAQKPVEKVSVYPWYVEIPKKGGHLNLSGLDEFQSVTDAKGEARFALPANNTSRITFWARTDDAYTPTRPIYDPASKSDTIEANFVRLVRLRGTVQEKDGNPVAGLPVRVAGGGYQFDRFRGQTTTKEDGSFEIRVYPNQFYMLVAGNKKLATSRYTKVILKQDIDNIKLVAQPAIRVFGRVLSGPNAKESNPMAGAYLSLYQQTRDYYDLPEDKRLPNPKDSNRSVSPLITQSIRTDAEGRFEFFAGPGDFYLIGPRNAEVPKFTLGAAKAKEVNIFSKGPETIPVLGRVVLRDKPSQGIAEAKVVGVPYNSRLRSLQAITGQDGKFKSVRGRSKMLVFAEADERKLAGVIELPENRSGVIVKVSPTGSGSARLLDANTKKPLAGEQVDYGIFIQYDDGTFNARFGGSTKTDKDGNFKLQGLVVGRPYRLNVVMERDGDGNPRSWRRIGTATAKQAGKNTLGEFYLPRK